MRHPVHEHLRSTLIAGFLFLVPLVLTYLILKGLFLKIDGIAQPMAQRLWGISFPGLGILLSLLFVYGVGLVSTHFIGRSLLNLGEKILVKIPLAKVVYRSFKEFLQIFLGGRKSRTKNRVVIVEYPQKGRKTFGFLTNSFVARDGKSYDAVLIPTVPNPTNGFLAIFPEEEVQETDISIEEASKFFLSAGILEVRKEL